MYASLESPESLFATVALFKKTNVPLMIPCLKKRYGLFFWKCKHKFLNTDVPFPLKQNLWPFFLYSELFHKTNLRAYFAFSTRLITPDQCKECIHVVVCSFHKLCCISTSRCPTKHAYQLSNYCFMYILCFFFAAIMVLVMIPLANKVTRTLPTVTQATDSPSQPEDLRGQVQVKVKYLYAPISIHI